MDPFDDGWTDFGTTWEEQFAALDPDVKVLVEAHARRLMETGYQEQTAKFVALEIFQDSERKEDGSDSMEPHR